nr:structural protein [Hepelivirales sp.]WAY16430.1 putative structural protein [Hepelivirales sp.]
MAAITEKKNGPIDHSTQMLSGGALSIENVNINDNSGRFDTDRNASTSTFRENILNNFLKFPTVLYDGTISSTMSIGATIYQSNVSPALMNSTSLTRISNFATNFRQWTGSMSARLIFTKPVFVQTKVIAAFIPGASIANSASISIADMYGAQYHVVMNPDNDNELEFKIPFISGVNWLDMENSTGLFIIKLFQPLIASQPTGVVNVSIPFTITLSSNMGTNADGEKLMPLNFRYLVAPSYQNQVLANDYREVLINSISPQIKDVATDKYAGFTPLVQTENRVAKTLIFMPRSKFNDFVNQNYEDINKSTGFVNTPNSLDSSRDLIFSNSNIPIQPPFSQTYVTGVSFIKVVSPYSTISSTSELAVGQYTLDSSSAAVRLCFCSNQLVAPPGTYTGSRFVFTNVNVSPFTFVCQGTVTLTIARRVGGYNYFIQTTDSNSAVAGSETIDFTKPIQFEFYPSSMNPVDYQNEKLEMRDIIKSDRNNTEATHFVLTSTSYPAEVKYQIQNGNYSNMQIATQDQMSASFADRALSTSTLVSEDSGIERIDFVSLLMLVKVGVDVIAKASRIISDVLTYVIPIFTVNETYVSSNQVITFDLVGNNPTYFEIDKTRSSIESYPDVDNEQLDVFTI